MSLPNEVPASGDRYHQSAQSGGTAGLGIGDRDRILPPARFDAHLAFLW
jgi:hypothetical protein